MGREEDRTTPTAADPRRLAPLVLAAWFVPALVPAAAAVAEWAGTGRLDGRRVLGLAAALAWMSLFLRRGWRGLLTDLAGTVLGRAGFAVPALIGLAAAAIGFGGGRGPSAAGIAAGLLLFAVAAGIHARATHRRRFRGQAALVGLYLVLFLALDLFIGAFILPGRSHNNLFAVHDEQLGWKLRPGLAVERDNEQFTSVERIGDDGFRGDLPAAERPAGTRRIVCLGDSHTEAYTVNNDETWSALLAGQLAATGPVETVNLGVGGFSTDQELLAYLHYGRPLHPDLVLLQFCSNDLPFVLRHRYWRGEKPLFVRHGSRLLLTNVPVPDRSGAGLASGPLLSRSSTLIFIESLQRQVALDRDTTRDVNLEEAWAVTRLLLRDLGELVREDGATLAVFNADPEKADVDRRLRRVLGELGIPYLDTAAAYTGGPFDGFWVASHWNRKGQRAIAETLAPAVALLLHLKEGR